MPQSKFISSDSGQQSGLSDSHTDYIKNLKLSPHLGQKTVIDDFSPNFSLQQPEYQHSVTADSLQHRNVTTPNSFQTGYESRQIMNQQNTYQTTQTPPLHTSAFYENLNIGHSSPSQQSFDFIQTQGIPNLKNVNSINNGNLNRGSQKYYPKDTLSNNFPQQPFQPISYTTSTASSIFPEAYPILGLTYPVSHQIQMLDRPERIQAEADRTATIVEYENNLTPDGDFSYSFDTSNGIHAEESGSSKDGVKAQGVFSYIGDDGKNYSITYTADENGYLPRGSHLPTQPPIPEAILKVIEQANKDKKAGIYHDGSYDDGKYGYKYYQEPISQHKPQIKSEKPLKQVAQIFNENIEKSGENKEFAYRFDSVSKSQNNMDDISKKYHYSNVVRSDYHYPHNHPKNRKEQQLRPRSENPIHPLSNKITGMSNINKLHLTTIYDGNDNQYLPYNSTNDDFKDDNQPLSSKPFNNGSELNSSKNLNDSPPKQSLFISNKDTLTNNELKNGAIISNKNKDKSDIRNISPLLYQTHPDLKTFSNKKPALLEDGQEIGYDYFPPNQRFNQKSSSSHTKGFSSMLLQSENQNKNVKSFMTPYVSFTKDDGIVNGVEQEPHISYDSDNSSHNNSNAGLKIQGNKDAGRNSPSGDLVTERKNIMNGIPTYKEQNYEGNEYLSTKTVPRQHPTGKPQVTQRILEYSQETHPTSSYSSGTAHISDRNMISESRPSSNNRHQIPNKNNSSLKIPINTGKVSVGNIPSTTYRPIQTNTTYKYPKNSYNSDQLSPIYDSENKARYSTKNPYYQEVSPSTSQLGYASNDRSINTTSRPKNQKEYQKFYQPGYPFILGPTASSSGTRSKPYFISDKKLFSTSPRTHYQENIESTSHNNLLNINHDNVQSSSYNPTLQADFDISQGPLSPADVVGDDFSGPSQPQYFDPITGYHY